jgi:hypothetical protein
MVLALMALTSTPLGAAVDSQALAATTHPVRSYIYTIFVIVDVMIE